MYIPPQELSLISDLYKVSYCCTFPDFIPIHKLLIQLIFFINFDSIQTMRLSFFFKSFVDVLQLYVSDSLKRSGS